MIGDCPGGPPEYCLGFEIVSGGFDLWAEGGLKIINITCFFVIASTDFSETL